MKYSELLALNCEEPIASSHEKKRKVIPLTMYKTPDAGWVDEVIGRFLDIITRSGAPDAVVGDFSFTWEYPMNGVASIYADIVLHQVGGLGKTARFAGMSASLDAYTAVPCISISSAAMHEIVGGDESDVVGYILDRVHLLPLSGEEADMSPADALDSYWRRKCDPYLLMPAVRADITDTRFDNDMLLLSMARAVASLKAEKEVRYE